MPPCDFPLQKVCRYIGYTAIALVYINMDVQGEIDALRAEIAGLRADLGPLQLNHDTLFRQVASYEASNKHHLQKHRPRNVPDEPTVSLDCFDDSIRQYFKPALLIPQAAAPPAESLSIQERTRQGTYSLVESVHRFGGITAFPINDALYDALDDALLGLRFDVLAHSSNAFLPSHYIILRRVISKDERHNWLVFRYTTPAYVSLDSYKHHLSHPDEALGLQKFCECVRAALVATQARHDMVQELKSLTLEGDKAFAAIESDIQCRRVGLTLNLGQSIELLLGSRLVDLVSSTLLPSLALHVSALLSGASIEKLQAAFTQVLRYIQSHTVA